MERMGGGRRSERRVGIEGRKLHVVVVVLESEEF